MNNNKTQSGFTFIDTVIGIVIMGISLTSILIILSDMNVKSTRSETVERGTAYANSVMHYIRMYRFDENYNNGGKPWTNPLGQDSGDNDDVDDYIGANWSVLIPGYQGFQAIVDVYYVDQVANDLLSQVNYTTDYKRITVSVSHSELSNPIVLTSIITPHGN